MLPGLVGRTALKVLEERKLPIDKYVLFASAKSAGEQVHFLDNYYTVQELNEKSFDENFDFAIFSAGGDVSKKYAPIAASKGTIVVDNSFYFRMKSDVPLVVPEVNSEDIWKNNGIIANPNCSTIQAVLPLKALDNEYLIKRVVYSTYQAVSGAGKRGIDDLKNTAIGGSPSKFPHPIYDNCLPHIDIFMNNGYTKEEMKMINETRKILHRPDLKITATTVRVPVMNSHSEAINVEFEKSFELSNLINVLKELPGIIVQDEPFNNNYPLATNATGFDEVFVGRIRRDESVVSGVNLWVVADNIRKGAATNAVQIVEKIIERNEL